MNAHTEKHVKRRHRESLRDKIRWAYMNELMSYLELETVSEEHMHLLMQKHPDKHTVNPM